MLQTTSGIQFDTGFKGNISTILNEIAEQTKECKQNTTECTVASLYQNV
jgi:hypothetical protein